MASDSFYLTRTILDDLDEVTVDGRSVVEAYDRLEAAIASRSGREVAALLAEPVITRGNGPNPASISWYAHTSGDPRPLAALDPDSRSAVEATLRAQLAQLQLLLDDPELGPLVGGAVHLAGRDDVWVVDRRPVLINWGLIPASAARTRAARDEHVRRTSGLYAALTRAPAISTAEWQERHGGRATPSPPPPPIVAPAAAVPPPPPPAVEIPVERTAHRSWVPVAIACAVLALILIYLLVPGVLLYPEAPAPAAAALDDQARLQDEANRALQDRADALKRALAQNSCAVTGELQPIPGDGGAPSPGSLLPPPPTALAVPPSAAPGQQGFQGSLVELLDKATALIVAEGQEGTRIGSGFFVAPRMLVTNFHVVEKATPDGLFVTNAALGGVKRAKVVQHTPDSEVGKPDFAVLEVDGTEALPHLALATALKRLDNVVAGGFPGVILDTDVNFQALKNGDLSAIPQMAVTQGVVTVIQGRGTGLPTIVVHTAAISPGNSGGPLVDSCGRVVGINTFIRVQQETASSLDYAIRSDAVAGFLKSAGVPFEQLTDVCQPQLTAAPPPSGTAPAAPGVPATPTPPVDKPSAP